MRTLLILGVLVVCVLLVTPSNGYRTGSVKDGGEKKSIDSGDLTVPARPSEIPLKRNKRRSIPCCRVTRRPPCRPCPNSNSPICTPSRSPPMISLFPEKKVSQVISLIKERVSGILQVGLLHLISRNAPLLTTLFLTLDPFTITLNHMTSKATHQANTWVPQPYRQFSYLTHNHRHPSCPPMGHPHLWLETLADPTHRGPLPSIPHNHQCYILLVLIHLSHNYKHSHAKAR